MLQALIKASEHFPYCLTIVDVNEIGRPCIHANHLFEVNTGYKVEEVIGKNLAFLQGERTELETIMFMRECFKKNEACVQDITNYKKNGEEFINRLLMLPITLDKRKLYIGFQNDITQKMKIKNANEKLKDVQSAEINHVVNNSLQVIFGYLVLKLDQCQTQEELQNRLIELTKHFEKINDYILNIEHLSEFENYKYL